MPGSLDLNLSKGIKKDFEKISSFLVRSLQNFPLHSNDSFSAPRQAAVDCPPAGDDRQPSQEEPRNGKGQGGNREGRRPGGQPNFPESLPSSHSHVGMGRGLIPPQKRALGHEYVRPVGHSRGRGDNGDIFVHGQSGEGSRPSVSPGLDVPYQDEFDDDEGDGYGSAVES